MIVRMPQAEVIATAEAQGLTTASIGPTSRRGWTTLWSEEVEESDRADYGAQYLAIDETPDGLLSVVKSFGPTVFTNVGPTFEALSGRCPAGGAGEALLCALA